MNQWTGSEAVALLQDPFTLNTPFLQVAPDVRLHVPTLDLLSASTGGRIYVFDPAGCCLYAGKEGAKALGLTPQEIIGKDLNEIGFPFEGIEDFLRDMTLAFATGQSETGETRLVTAWGVQQHAYTLHPLVSDVGMVAAVAVTLRDITARKQAESELHRKQAEVEALNAQLRRAMTETHHRVKNNLQLIAAMIDMRIMASDAPLDGTNVDADHLVCSINDMRRLSGCVRTLAVVHDILTHEAKSDALNGHVSVRAMLERLLPLMQETTSTRHIRRSLDDARLPVRQSTSLALIANELISNALKYGQGDINVTFKVQNEQAALAVSDDGPGFPVGFDPIKAANTGLELVESLTRLDLSGHATYVNQAEGGGRVVVTMPLNVE